MTPKRLVSTPVLATRILAATVVFLMGWAACTGAQGMDYTGLSWTDAFDALHDTMSMAYGFTDWKGIDWAGMYAEHAPCISAAQDNGDFEGYYLALRSYIRRIADGHVGVSNIREIDDKYIGGGFGLAATRLCDDSVIASWVDERGAAWKAGIRAGATLTEWAGLPIDDAVAGAPMVFSGNIATREAEDARRTQFLVRAAVGASVHVVYRNPGDANERAADIVAYDDGRMSLAKTYPDSVVSDALRAIITGAADAGAGVGPDTGPGLESIVQHRMMEGNIGYIKLLGEIDMGLLYPENEESTLELFREAIGNLADQGAVGLVLDIRNNIGGFDEMAADILGSFYAEKTFYEYQSMYNPDTDAFEIVMADPEAGSMGLYIEPAPEQFHDPVIALINQKCVSSGEGIAMGIRNLPNGDTLGYYGTNGSFGMAGAEVLMPGGLLVRFPFGQSLDENQQIQLDSRGGIGGVAPTIRIPMTAQNALRAAAGEDVELEEAIRLLSGQGGTR